MLCRCEATCDECFNPSEQILICRRHLRITAVINPYDGAKTQWRWRWQWCKNQSFPDTSALGSDKPGRNKRATGELPKDWPWWLRPSVKNTEFCLDWQNVHNQRWQTLAKELFAEMCKPTSCLHYLLPGAPASWSNSINKTPWAPDRTKKYQSFVNFALKHYQ